MIISHKCWKNNLKKWEGEQQYYIYMMHIYVLKGFRTILVFIKCPTIFQ